MKKLSMLAVCCAALMSVACTSTGNIERNAAGGAVLGGVAGAVIGNNTGDGNAGRGAAIGAGAGAIAGGVRGMTQDQKVENCRIGASREKVNRKLHDWNDEGFIELSRSGVKLKDKARLEALIHRSRNA